MARVTVLGGGHGVAAVLEALREDGHELTAVVSMADDGGSSGELRRRWGGAAVGDLRRALIALSGRPRLATGLARRIPCCSLGRHPVGNLLLRALTDAFDDDLQTAADRLGGLLRARGRVIGATVAEVTLVGLARDDLLFGESAISSARTPIHRLRFSPARPQVAAAAVDAVMSAEVVLLGPGSLFTSVLAVAALPDLKAALASTPARIVCICNLADEGETRCMSGGQHLDALRREAVRVDAVLHDPVAAVHLGPDEITRANVEEFAGTLCAGATGAHDPARLRSALSGIVSMPYVEGRPAPRRRRRRRQREATPA
jgi:uncharacterized cofD-like protein